MVRFARRLSVPDVVLRAGGAAIRVRPWPADAATAQVLPVPGAVLPSPQEVGRWMTGLSRLGYHRVRTAALGEHDQRPYREAGLDPLEELVLLRRPLTDKPPRAPRRVRRARRSEWAELPEVDAAAFASEWHLDHDAIVDACRATPRHRLRVADAGAGPIGYVVHGRAGHTGYVQRLAVRPEAAGQGWGSALVLDGLGWMAAAGCIEALVNTHADNERALALYDRLGFRALPDGLVVLGSTLGDAPVNGVRPAPVPPASARRRRARLAGLAVVALAAPVVPVTAAMAQSSPATTLQLVSQKLVIAPDEPLIATLAVNGPVPDGAELAVTVSSRLRPEREGLHGVLDEGAKLGGTVDFLSIPLAAIPRDGAGRLSVTVPTVRKGSADKRDTLRLTAAGLYPVTFELRTDQSDPVSSVLSFIERSDDSVAISPLSVALVTAVESPPAFQPDGSVVVSERARSDLTQLAAALAHNPTVPATVSLPPELLERLAASPAPEDQQLMQQLTAALPGREVLSRPYVTMDPSTSAHAGLSADYTRLLAQGEDTLRALFPGVTPDRSLYLVRGDVDGAGLQLLRNLGALNVVLPSVPKTADSEEAAADPTRTVQVRAGDGSVVRAAVLDPDLMKRLTATDDPVLAAHYMATELIALQSEAPDQPGRGVVILPPPGLAVDPVFLGTLEDLISQIPELRPVDLAGLFSLTTTAIVEGASPHTIAAPGGSVADRSSVAFSIAERRLEIGQVASMLPADDTMARDLRQVLDLSLAEDLTDTTRNAYLSTVDSRLGAVTGSIVPMDRRQFTITSRRTTIPITVRTKWAQPLRVKVRLSSPKLSFPKGDQIITVTQDSPPFRVPVEAKTNGTFQVTATLLTPDGDAPLGPPIAITVRSTALSGLGILVTIAAALGLAAWWIQHLRSKRRRRAAAASAERHPTAPIDRDQLVL